MTRTCRRTPPRSRAAGFAMIEVLIAMFLIAIWMLASAGTQIASLKFQKSAGNRAMAVALVGELSERMEANLAGAKAGNYALQATPNAVTSSTDCTAVYCTPAQMAAFDLAQWSSRVATTVPATEMSVVAGVTATGLVNYTISVKWSEPRGRQTYADTGTSETLSYVLTKTVRNAS